MDLRYPIGPFRYDELLADESRPRLIDQIEAAPARLRAAVEGLSPQQLDTPYRPGGGPSDKSRIISRTAT